jgi:single-stranded DNA-binding protein
MTSLCLHFSGHVKRADFKNIGGKAAVEISLCRKNYTKQGDEPTFTWVSALVWEPKEWQAPKLVKGAFVSGRGELTLRSYEKDGQKRTSAEVRCSSFEIEIAGEDPGTAQAAPVAAAAAPRKPVAAPADDADSEPPFN